MPTKSVAIATRDPITSEATIAAWLAEVGKGGRSTRTPAEYGRIVRRFLADDRVVDPLSVEAMHGFAYGPDDSGEEPKAGTIAMRVSALRSYFSFLVAKDK